MTKEEQKTFLELLADIPEFRKGNAIKYSLRDVLFLAIFAILCGADTYTGMHTFSELHIQELRKYLELPEEISSHDVFGDIFSDDHPVLLLQIVLTNPEIYTTNFRLPVAVLFHKMNP